MIQLNQIDISLVQKKFYDVGPKKINMRISYSSLECFQNCPQKYKFSEIDKIKEPKSKEAVFGSYIHEVLHWFYKNDPHFPTLENLLAYYQEHWSDKKIFKWEDEKTEKEYLNSGIDMLKRYYETNADQNLIIMDLESRFEAVIDETPNETGGKHILSGIIDRIDKLADGTFEIIDYKTGKRMPSKDQLENNLQLSIYAIGLKERWPKINVSDLRLTLYYLKPGEKLVIRKQESDLERIRNQVIGIIHEIQNSSFEPRTTPLCNWCGFKKICPAWRHQYEKDDKSEINTYIDEYLNLKIEYEKNVKRIKELKDIINKYCEDNKLEQLFGTNGSLSRVNQETVAYNLEKIKAVLMPLGKWDKILSIDAKRLEEVIREIPPDAREIVKNARIVKNGKKIITTN